MCVLSVELYDQIPELCLYLHTDFPAFFPFILCTNKKQHFFYFISILNNNSFAFQLSSMPSSMSPIFGLIILFHYSKVEGTK